MGKGTLERNIQFINYYTHYDVSNVFYT